MHSFSPMHSPVPIPSPSFGMTMAATKYEDLSPTQSSFGFMYDDAGSYGEPDTYMDHTNGSVSQGSDSPYEKYTVPYFNEYTTADVYPSPEGDAISPPPEDSMLLPKQEYSAEEAGMATPTAATANLTTAAPDTTTAINGAQKAPAKRKRENRYKNAPPSVLSRRRAQNRASQRAYRERKDQRIKDLEQMLSDAKHRNDTLNSAYMSLQHDFIQLKVRFGEQFRASQLPPHPMHAAHVNSLPLHPHPQSHSHTHTHSHGSISSLSSVSSLGNSSVTPSVNPSVVHPAAPNGSASPRLSRQPSFSQPVVAVSTAASVAATSAAVAAIGASSQSTPVTPSAAILTTNFDPAVALAMAGNPGAGPDGCHPHERLNMDPMFLYRHGMGTAYAM